MKKKALATAIAATLFCSVLAAKEGVNEIANDAKQIQNNHSKHIDPEWLKTVSTRGDIFKKSATALGKQSADIALASMTDGQEAAEIDKAIMSDYKYLIFASFSLTDAGLKDILISASGREDTAVVFRGVPDGLRIDEGMYKLQEIAKQVEPAPNVILDPTPFKENNITVVPTMIVRGEDKQTIAIVKGLHNPDWIQEQVDAGKIGDLGFLGTAELIAERDIIEVMQERANAIDWDAKKEGALKRAWGQVKYADLPPAKTDRTRKIPASVKVTSDIKTPDGTYIARAGDVINPLAVKPFTTAYIVFNPTIKKEVDFAKKLKQKTLKDYQSVVFMFSGFEPGEDGWQSFKGLTDEMDSHVYNLVPEVQQRFVIEKTPTLVTADSENFIVTEFHLSDSGDTQ